MSEDLTEKLSSYDREKLNLILTKFRTSAQQFRTSRLK
jgi:hypothetical protein